jgi:tRNA threonylcarbamoyladenosine biosynthesis protein TsaB
MLTLAIQTAVGEATAALLDDAAVLGQRTIADRFAVCRELAPEMEQLLQAAGKQPSDLQLIAVCLGPGSFTGIRIGVATAKALAHSLALPLVGANTLEAAASAALQENPSDCLVLQAAGKGRYFTAAYAADLSIRQVPRNLSEEAALALLSGDQVVVICGESLPALEKAAADRKPPWLHQTPDAVAVGRLGQMKHAAGETADPLTLSPYYLRLSSPEERAEAKV